MSSDIVRSHQMAQGSFYGYDLYEKRILTVLYGVFVNLPWSITCHSENSHTFANGKRTSKVDCTNDIINKVVSLGGTISTTDISYLLEYKQVLRARERGDLIRLRHRVYTASEVLPSTMVDVERIIPNDVICLYNAWTYHQLSTTVPPAFYIAIANKRKVVLPCALSIELYYWRKKNLEFGVMDTDILEYKVHITDIGRSVCDAVKYRNKIGPGVCAETVHTYLKKPDHNLARLQDYAKCLRVFNTLKNCLEVAIK